MLISFLQSVKLTESDFCMHHIVKLLILLTVDYQNRIHTHKADYRLIGTSKFKETQTAPSQCDNIKTINYLDFRSQIYKTRTVRTHQSLLT